MGKSNLTIDLCVGIDIGNAKTEVAYKKNGSITYVRQPSVVSYLTSKPDANDIDRNSVMAQLFDNLIVQTFSKGLREDGLYFIGEKALLNSENIRNMPIFMGGKSSNDIPVLTSLSLLSGIGLKEYYEAHETLPKTLTINVKMATAIPSSEYSNESAKHLEDRFLGEHQVNMFVGEDTVLVIVNITHCKVTEEGRTAMLAFANSDADILSNYNKTYNKDAVPADFSEALALHADIGDGTSEIVATKGFNPIPNASRGLRVGVGHATQNAIELYRTELGNMAGEITRQHFMNTVSGKNEKARIAKAQLKKATKGQAIKILDKINDGFAQLTSSGADFFFVHGGGSIVFKDDLYEDLIRFAELVKAEVVWIPEEYATRMNSKGTFYLAQYIFCKED